MILAAGLSPAWQQIMVFERVQPGEVNRAAEVHWCASGKVLNVGQALARLDCEHLTLSLLGGKTGQAIERAFAEQEVACRWVWSSSPTRVCTTVVERGVSRITELVENAAPASHESIVAFQRAYREVASRADVVVLTGSLPAGLSATFFRELLEHTQGRVILDIRGSELLAAVAQRPLLVKPNRAELAATVGRTIESDAALVSAMRALNERGAAWVLISHGGGAVWLSSASEVFRIEVPPVTLVNPIGSGDCLAAGVAWGLVQGLTMPEAVRLGIGAAMENARQLLPARLDGERVREQATRLTIEHVSGA